MIATENRFNVPGTTWLSRHDGDTHKHIFEYGTVVPSIGVQIGFCNDPDIREDSGFYLEVQYYHLAADGFTYSASIEATLDLEQVRVLRSYCEFLLANHEVFEVEPEPAE